MSTPITGDYLYKYVQQKCNADYTTFIGGVTKANRLFLDAFLAVLEERFKGIESQQYRDEIGYLIKTQQVFQLNNNSIYEAPLQITYITFQTNTATITTYLPHNLINNDQVTLSGVQGVIIPTINNSFLVTIVSPMVFTIPFTWSSGAYTINTGTLTTPKMIADYWQMIQVSARFDTPYQGDPKLDIPAPNITNVGNTTPVQITLDQRTNIRTGMRGYINQNPIQTPLGDVYFNQLNDFTYSLYSDQFLQVPIAPIAGWTSGGAIYKTDYKVAKPFLPRTKISPLGQPTPNAPRWKDSQRQLIFYPLNVVCKELTVDYYAQPDVTIDCANTITDYSNYFSQKLLMHLADVVAILYAQPARDEVLFQESVQLDKMKS